MNYCISDLHGNYDVWKKIKNKITKNDTLYILGDVIDRGQYGILILNEIMCMNNIIFFLGNHEDMMLSTIKCGYTSTDVSLWVQNGGKDTLNSYLNLLEQDKDRIINFLECAEIYKKIKIGKNIYHLSHSGFNKSDNNIHDFLWSRDHIKKLNWEFENNEYMIFGHTPVQLLDHSIRTNKLTPFNSSNGHRICIDGGSVWSNKSILYNLDENNYEII